MTAPPYTRHQEVPPLSAWPSSVDAALFHTVYRALKRKPPAIRLVLPGLKTLDLILQPDAWIVVDRAYNDLPVAAWSEFRAAERQGLHEPVACELRYFHGYAGMIVKRVLDAVDELLNARPPDGEASRQVIAFPLDE